MTDPFVSYQKLADIVLGFPIKSNQSYISKCYGNIAVPDAIFIGHSHYDHMMDTVSFLESKENDSDRCNIPIYGSQTTKHILHGYRNDCICHNTNNHENRNWSSNFKQVISMGEWKRIERVKCSNQSDKTSSNIHYKAFVADHAPHLRVGPSDVHLFQGHLFEPLKEPPKNAYDYKEGYTYVYLFKFSKNDSILYKVALAGAATNVEYNDLQFLDEPVDVLILSVPGWKYKDQYPKELIRKLKPRYIILSHFDNFFEPDRDKIPIKTVLTAGLDEFILKIQDDIYSIDNYNRFEKIIIPDVNSTIYIN